MNDHNIGSHYASDNTVLARYYHGPVIDELLCRVTETNTVYYHHDGLGSTVALTDSTGNVVESYTYDVYGQSMFWDSTFSLQPSSLQSNRFLFTGREYLADLALYDYRHRFYSPSLGRFLQTDPLRFDAEDVNLYRYVGNAVIGTRDPFGLLDPVLQVVRQAVRLYLPETAESGLECCAVICCNSSNGEKYLGSVQRAAPSNPHHCPIGLSKCKNGDREVGVWHTHPQRSSYQVLRRTATTEDMQAAQYWGVSYMTEVGGRTTELTPSRGERAVNLYDHNYTPARLAP